MIFSGLVSLSLAAVVGFVKGTSSGFNFMSSSAPKTDRSTTIFFEPV